MTLKLSSVTLVCYDCRAHSLAKIAIEDAMGKIEFGHVQVWTDRVELFNDLDIELIEVDGTLNKNDGQRSFWYGVGHRLHTDHALNLEWDAGVVDPDMWDDDFLSHDYIGAPWPWHEPGLDVGNGGFTLLSKRLMNFLSDNESEFPFIFPPDATICRTYRTRLEAHGFSWPDKEMAERFALEYGDARLTFGYHDCRLWPLLLSMPELDRRIKATNDFVRNHESWRSMIQDLRTQSRRMNTVNFGLQQMEHRPVHSAIHELNQLAVELAAERKYDAAIVVAQRAIRIMPRSPELWSNLSTYYWNKRDYQAAFDCANRSRSIDPDCVLAWGALGLALQGLKRFDEAEAAFNTVLIREPNNHRVIWDRALLNLERGRYEQGWADYEARIPYKGRKVYPNFRMPIWKGEDLTGKTVFIHAEQGVGDQILFARFFPWISGLAARVIVCCSPQATVLLWGYREFVEFLPEGAPVPEADYVIHMASLVYRYGATLDKIPIDPGIIRTMADKALNGAPVQVPIPEGLPFKPFRIGICWTGNPAMDRNSDRSIPLEMLFQLASNPKIWLYSLQVGPASTDIDRIGARDLICDQTYEFARRGYVATAAAMLQLDLVITCCTSIAHLAGALGLSAWVLLCEDPYWVWGRNTTQSTPWWPSLRLFRQQTMGEWKPVIDEVQQELDELLKD